MTKYIMNNPEDIDPEDQAYQDRLDEWYEQTITRDTRSDEPAEKCEKCEKCDQTDKD